MALTSEAAWKRALEAAKDAITDRTKPVLDRYEAAAGGLLRAVAEPMIAPGNVIVLRHVVKGDEPGESAREMFGYLIPFHQGYVALVLESGITTVYRVLKFNPVQDDGAGGNDWVIIERWIPGVAIPVLPV